MFTSGGVVHPGNNTPANRLQTLHDFVIYGYIKSNADWDLLSSIGVTPLYRDPNPVYKMYSWYKSWGRWPSLYPEYANSLLFKRSLREAALREFTELSQIPADGINKVLVGLIGPPLVKATASVLLFARIPDGLVKQVNQAYGKLEKLPLPAPETTVPLIKMLHKYANTATPAERTQMSKNLVRTMGSQIPHSVFYIETLAKLNPTSPLNQEVQYNRLKKKRRV